MLTAVHALTFDYSCSNPVCPTPITLGALLATVVVNTSRGAGAGLYSMSYTCPVCGSTESYNSGLTSAETTLGPDDDQTQATQAQLVRLMQTQLGLSEAP